MSIIKRLKYKIACKVLVFLFLFGCVVIFNETFVFLGSNQPTYNATVAAASVNDKSHIRSKERGKQSWWDPHVNYVAVVYHSSYNNSEDFSPWCTTAAINSPNTTVVSGLVYVKIPKTASSTCAGISLRLAHNIAARKHHSEVCPHTAVHGFAYTQRQYPYLLWTSIRHPSDRVVSEFFFTQVSQHNVLPTAVNMLHFFSTKKSFQLDYISRIKLPGHPPQTRYAFHHGATVEEALEVLQKDVFGQYHFLLIMERMDESLAVFHLLYHFPLTDMIVFSSKASKNHDGMWNKACHKIAPKVVPPEIQIYLDTNFTYANYDFLLYAAANRSLDQTIAALGKERVNQAIARLQSLRALAEESCRHKTIFPCSPNGTYQASAANCYERDLGCGYPCMDELFFAKEEPIV